MNVFFKDNLWKLAVATICIISSLCLVYLVPQIYGKIALAISVAILAVVLIKLKWLKNILFIVGLCGVVFVLYSGFAFYNFTQNKKTIFDSIDYAVVFEKGTFEQTLKKAKELDKPIFVDFYTAWCTPCLAFSKNVLTDEEVGKYMNQAFLNLKYDAEKGEGKEIADRYNVSSYPTLLLLDGNGEIIERVNDNIVPNKEKMIKTAKGYISSK